MKKIFKSLLTVFVSLTMLFSLTVNVAAIENTASSDEQRLISEILTYFSYSKGDFNERNGWTASSITADVDIQRCLNELKELNPELGEAFTNIMDYWIYADTTMPIYSGILPDGLPTDNSLCIVTLGYQLNQTTGEMQQELIDRLMVTLESSIKYPNASIVVTGGGTSPADPSKTEGEEMAKWLIAHGVDENRIIVENKAPTTVGNATNTFRLLKEKPEIKSIAMISSSSHIQRAVAIFQAVFQLEAYKANTDAIEILNNTSCPVDRQETLRQQMNSVTEAINTCLNSKNIGLIADLSLSTLDSIEITNVNNLYGQGAKVEPKVIAHLITPAGEKYDLDVTEKAEITNIDTSKLGSQVLKVTYSYNDVIKDASKTIVVNEIANNKVAIKIAIDLANQANLNNVIPVVVEEFNIALQEANTVYNNAYSTQEEVDNAFDRLASVMQKLEFFKGDKTALKAFIDKVNGLEAKKYTETTWVAFNKVLDKATAVYNDENAMQEEVNNAYNELVTAFLKLRLIPDKSLLEELINEANGLNEANYTKATFDGLTKALNEAKVVFDNPNASQVEVDNAKDVLAKAIAGLQTVKKPVNNGDTTVSVKTGDETYALTFVSLMMLTACGYTYLRRKEL